MDDKYGLKAAADRGITLRDIGDRILLENEFVRVWEVKLEPGETLGFHIHYHPYLVLSLERRRQRDRDDLGQDDRHRRAGRILRVHQRDARSAPADQQIEPDLSFAADRDEVGYLDRELMTSGAAEITAIHHRSMRTLGAKPQ